MNCDRIELDFTDVTTYDHYLHHRDPDIILAGAHINAKLCVGNLLIETEYYFTKEQMQILESLLDDIERKIIEQLKKE